MDANIASPTKPSSEWVHVTPGNPQEVAASASPQDAEGSEMSPPAKRRKEDKERSRVSRACDRCKKKKTRCTGRCPCALCLRAGLPCEFTASYTRGRLPSVIVDEAAMAGSTRPRISMPAGSTPETLLKDHIQPPLANSTFDRPTTTTDGATDRLNVASEESARDPPSRASPEATQTDQQGHYVGPASGVSFLLRIQKRLHQNSDLSHDTSIFTFGDAPLPEYDPSFFVLPPKTDAQRLVERYFDFAAPTFRFLHRPTIESLLHEFYDTQGEMRTKEESTSRTALLLMVLAQAQAYMPTTGADTLDKSARFFFAAEHQLSKERGAVRLASVQARLGQCFYLLSVSRINHCWSLFGTTAHLILAIGLNRGTRGTCTTSTDYVELEGRRRLFWSAYSLDKYLAAALGRPRTFKDEDIDQELPTIINDSDLFPNNMSPSTNKMQSMMMAPIEHIKLSRIISLVLRDLYPIRPPSMAHRVELAAKYSKDLHDWRMNLTRFLDAEGVDTSLLIPLYQRQRNVLNLAYYHAILLVQRPFLISNFAKLAHIDHRPGNISNIDTSRNIAECLEAAMAIVRIVDDLFQGSQIFRAFWFTQYKAFCAVVVLYIYRIQQHYVEPGKCEGYFTAGQKCQAQLSSISETDCLSKRYCLVLEELRIEALKQTQRLPPSTVGTPNLTTTASADPAIANITTSIPMPGSTPQSDGSANFSYPYGVNIPPTPESAGFGQFGSASNLLSDFTSWGQFDSLVTGGIGPLDGGFQSDFGLNFGIGG